jgi:hypothetical protein
MTSDDENNNNDKNNNGNKSNNDNDETNNDKIGDDDNRGAADNDDPFDPVKLRLSQDFAAGQAVKKILTKVPVRKPDKQWFVRVRPGEDWRLSTAFIELKEDRELYLVDRPLVSALSAEVVPMVLFTCVTRHGVVFLWPIPLPGEDGKHNEWHRSALEAARRAESRWIRVVSNFASRGYDVFEAIGALPEPEWPDVSFAELLKIAFGGRFIRSADHPVVRRLRGDV